MTDRRLSVREAAKLAQCSHKTIRKAVSRGEIPAYLANPYSTAKSPRLLVKPSEVRAFFEKAVYRPTTPEERSKADRIAARISSPWRDADAARATPSEEVSPSASARHDGEAT